MTGTHAHRIDSIRCVPTPTKSLIPLSLYESIKIFLFTVTFIAPIRFLAIWFLLLIGWLLAKLGSVGIKPGIRSPPPTLFNTVIKWLLRIGIRWIMYIAGFFYVFVDGAADPRAKVLVSTHSSLWDSLWLIFYLGTTQGAKVELFTLPIMGDFLKALLSLPIDRNSADGRRVAIGEIALRCADPHYPPLLLFPTGCCTNTRQLIQFKRGAFQPLCPIQPIGISYPSRFYDMKLNSSSLWDLYRSVCQFANHMAVTFLPIRYPSADEREDPILWSRNVREEMAVKLGMQLVDYRYEDEMIRIQCRDSNVYLNDLKIEIKNYPLIEKLLDAFVLVDTNNDGWICLDDIQIAAGRHISVTEYGDLLATVKLPPIDHYCYSNRDHFPNYDTWTEQGWIGWLTGGRPKLQKRGIDLYLPNKIEFAEVVNYINKLTDPHMSKHTKRIDYFVDMFGASNILVD